VVAVRARQNNGQSPRATLASCPAEPAGLPSRHRRRLRALAAALVGSLTLFVLQAGIAFAAQSGATGATGASGGDAPGVHLFDGLTGWIRQYGWAGAPLAISLGGILMTVEHHQQRTGNAIRAKGYIFAAAAGVIVISLAGTATSALATLAHYHP
jgi:hypothetical protein